MLVDLFGNRGPGFIYRGFFKRYLFIYLFIYLFMFLSDIYLADFLSVINLETVGPDLFSGFFKRYLFGNRRPRFI